MTRRSHIVLNISLNLKERSMKFYSTGVLLAPIFFLMLPLLAASSEPWMRHPEKDAPHEKKAGSIMTWYWTFDPENADDGWDEWTKGAQPQDPVHLKGTSVTVPRNMANKYNLEGSGWYTEDGGHRVINIIEPHVKPESTLFKEVDYVDYGLDAPHYHYGLVPFRTIAAVHDDIPAGTWVYIPMFDGIQIPVYDLDNRWNVNYSFWHDGWFRVSDISWSFADNATQIDLFAGTVQAVTDAYSQLWNNFTQTEIWNETKQEFQTLDTYNGEISLYYKADVPVYVSKDGDAIYRYSTTVDTVHNDTRPAEYVISENLREESRCFSVDLDNDSYGDDLLVYNYASKSLEAYVDCVAKGINLTDKIWELSFSGLEVFDFAVSDYNGSGRDGFVVATNKGILAGSLSQKKLNLDTLSREIAEYITTGDYNNDNKSDVVIFAEGTFKKASYESWSLKLGNFTTLSGVVAGNTITALTSGDLTAEGQDELIIGTATGVWSYNFTGSKRSLYSDDVTSPDALHAVYVDPDGFADIFAIDDGMLKAKYSSHKVDAPFVSLAESGRDWITFAAIDPREINKSAIVSVVHPVNRVLKDKRQFNVHQKRLTVPYSAGVGELQICALNGREIARVSPQKRGESAVYDLRSLSVGKQPLVFSVDVDGVRATQLMYLK